MLILGLFLALVAGDPADYYHEKRPLLVQPIPEPKPICHVEYDVSNVVPKMADFAKMPVPNCMIFFRRW